MDDRDDPQDIDLEPWDDDEDTVECPYCGQEVYDGVVRCPYCRAFLFGDSPAGRRAHGWFWPIMVAVLVAVILVMWHGFAR